MTWLDSLLGGDSGARDFRQKPNFKVQDYNALRQQCLASGSLWKDPSFSPRDTTVCQWLRPHEIASAPKFVSQGVSRFDVVQGELGDCWLVAAVANLTLNQKLYNLVVPPDQSFDRGAYCGVFRFRFWQFGEWVEVVIDDRLPTRDGKLIFMRSSDPDEFWSCLIEKAYAKLHGGYDALRGGTTCEAMVDLTGGVTEFYDIQSEEAPENLFTIIKKALERGSLIGCSIEAQDESQRENELPNGLVKGHAYSVTSVLETNLGGRQASLLRLRNPWSGTSEWNGPWCDKSREWSMVSDYEKRRIGLCFEADGEFWIPFSDFKYNFTRVELCNLTPDSCDTNTFRTWHAQMFEGCWIRGRTAGGCRNNLDTFAMNPQYVITLTDPDEDDNEDTCTTIVALMQKNRRSTKKYMMGSSDLTIGFAIYSLQQGGGFGGDPVALSRHFQQQQQLLSTDFFKYNTSVARSPTFINLREVTARFKLPPGTYVIVPSTFDKGEEGEFLLRVWSEAPTQSAPNPTYPSIEPSQPVEPPRPVPPPRPTPSPKPAIPDEPSRPVYPPYPKPSGDDGDKGKTTPSYPPYPTGPFGPMPGVPSYPSYPPYPQPGGGGGGGGGGDIRYPTIPDEPAIPRRHIEPPPPGPFPPGIDISIGEVIGFVATLIGIMSTCYNTYQRLKNPTAQTYPFGATQDIFARSPSDERGFRVYSPNPNSGPLQHDNNLSHAQNQRN